MVGHSRATQNRESGRRELKSRSDDRPLALLEREARKMLPDAPPLAVVSAWEAEPALAAMRNQSLGKEAAIIGEATVEHAGFVVLKTRVGGTRVVDMLSGEQLPPIC